jgi:tRNA dimethylallyltransferase
MVDRLGLPLRLRNWIACFCVDVDALMLAGPTASGKTAWAMALAERLPIEIVSVDSAQVYRGLDIGSAKPTPSERAKVPHHLLDLRDPSEHYSAGQFRSDALRVIKEIRGRGRIPLLVGGTMLYFNALLRGLAQLPSADPNLRRAIDAEAARVGWPRLHAELATVDPELAARLAPQDAQRIQRGLEVYRASGRPLSAWQAETNPEHALRFARCALVPSDRGYLHRSIERRFDSMMQQGLLEEVRRLAARGDLSASLPALRAVGYRQLWAHLAGECSLEEAVLRAVIATRQLAKRQLTWINADSGWTRYDPLDTRSRDMWMATMQSVCHYASQ